LIVARAMTAQCISNVVVINMVMGRGEGKLLC
jgi:hypothetical protein